MSQQINLYSPIFLGKKKYFSAKLKILRDLNSNPRFLKNDIHNASTQ